MSDHRVILLGPAMDADESERALERLGRIVLPTASKHVVTTGKFDARHLAATFNVEAGYPNEPARLQTLAALAETGDSQPRFRDGYDLYCLRRFLAKGHEGDFVVMVRDDADLTRVWPELQERIEGRLFLVISEEPNGSVILNLRDPQAAALLETVLELYLSGAVYAMEPYSFSGALTAAAGTLRLQASI